MLTYKAIYKNVEGGVHAELVDFPGVITCAGDLVEARQMIRSALVDMAETYLLEGRAIPLPFPLADPSDIGLEPDITEPVTLELRSRGRHVGSTAILSRGDLVRHVFRLMDDFRQTGDEWENPNLPSFFEALAAWLSACDAVYRNLRLPIDADSPSWQLFADALSAAVVYE